MAIDKTVSPCGWDFDDRIVAPIKLGSDGRFLGANDRRDFYKRASAGHNPFLQMIEDGRVKFSADEEPVHLIALGAKEAYGANRNGDAFTESVLKEAHDTFVKFARWFRNHKNKPAEGHPSYGLVKASTYNPVMRRVELLCALNRTKAAADRNGGLVADRELEKLAAGDDIAVSMACRVPYDICSGCGNKARTRDEYCKAASCKYGGCYDNLAMVVKSANDFHMLHVLNPSPVFFDISNVFRPADRIAYGGKASWMQKAAAAGWDGRYEGGGAKTAFDLGVTAPLAVVLAQTLGAGEWTPRVASMVKLAHAIAHLDRDPAYWATAGDETRRAFAADVQPPIDLTATGLDSGNPEKVGAALGALADQKIVLPLRDFARMTKRAELADAAGIALKGACGRMIADGSLERRLAHTPYAPVEKLATGAQRQWAARHAEKYSLDRAAVQTRCLQHSIRGHQAPDLKSTFWNEKTAADAAGAEELARDYACYKVAALQRIAAFDAEFPLTVRISICQNQVI